VNQEERNRIIDMLSEPFQIVEDDRDASRVPGTLESWGEAVGHPLGPQGCWTCGRGVSCPFRAFYEAMIASVVRELDRFGKLTPEGVHLISKLDPPEGEMVLPLRSASPVPDSRGPVTWYEHGPDRHGPETGCVECRCLDPKGHAR
jgi:hypothetical protein